MRPFLAALQFLTVIPLPGCRPACAEELERAFPYYPLIGLIIGGFLAIVDAGLRQIFPLFLTSVVLVVILLLISGGLHCDGLADTADGFFSSRPREQILQIMKDSRTGPMGVMAVVAVILLKVAAFSAVPAPVRWWTLLFTPPAAYVAMMLNVALLRYARAEGGLGGIHARRRYVPQVLGASLLLLAAGWFAGGRTGLCAVAGTLLVGLLLAAYARHKIGGYTGDTLGAVYEIASIAPALAAAAWGAGGMAL